MRIHMMGVGGVGMAGLALLLKMRGHAVTGCDLRATKRTAWLEHNGIRFSVGHDPTHVYAADILIVTPAVPADAPERAAAACVQFRGEVLAELVSETPDTIAVCGSHGKTTTSSWIARLLLALGEDVTWCIGGETGDFPVAGRTPGCERKPIDASVLVVEADESDGTLAQYHAKTLVVTNCEYDHPDHFKTPAEYVACFDAARKNAQFVLGGPTSVSAVDSPELESILAPLAEHNRQNARTAIEVALRRGHLLAEVLRALPAVVTALPDRRFQKLADGIYTDYAHHPTEMACAVKMARAICRGTLRVVFQPHRYSRTKALLKDFPAAFAGADEVILCPVYAAFEQPIVGGTSEDLHAVCRVNTNIRWFLAPTCAAACQSARAAMRPGDLTLILGAGDIINCLTV